MTHLAPDDMMEESHPQLSKSHHVRFGNRYTLHPGNFVLSATLEWIRLPRNMAAYVIGRSSWGRRGLIIATATGVHPSFTGCLTLELTNVGELPICIYPGMTICQLFFHNVECGQTGAVDHSQFVCSRKPSVGKILLSSDAFAWKLAKA
jgi:dCTP deaminase